MIREAMVVRLRAYAPYSNFRVGAVLLGTDGRVFTGCNVESISFGLTCCAERAAIFTAIAAGTREFSRIVVCADSEVPVTMCGACRQVMAEFSPSAEIISVNLAGSIQSDRLDHLLPRPKSGILGST